jgi:hypothetical protein
MRGTAREVNLPRTGSRVLGTFLAGARGPVVAQTSLTLLRSAMRFGRFGGAETRVYERDSSSCVVTRCIRRRGLVTPEAAGSSAVAPARSAANREGPARARDSARTDTP